MVKPVTSDDEVLRRFVEQLALVFVESGMPRMPARVFAYVLAEDSNRYTAAELAHGLQVSPAAISGAVRVLVTGGLLAKEREPGARADHYRIYDDDVWSHIIMQREPLLKRYADVLSEGIRQLGSGPGAQRLAETLDYMEFLRDEMPLVMERWQERRRRRRLRGSSEVEQ